MKDYGQELISLLTESAHNFSAKGRNEFIKALMLLRSKNMVDPIKLFQLFFKLFRLKDKKLREIIHKFIVRDVKQINNKTKNHQINKSLQNIMYTMLQDQDANGT